MAIKSDRPKNIFYDVDGTLIDLSDNPNLFEVTRIILLKLKGHRIFLWSENGKDYAKQVANELEKIAEKVFKLNLGSDSLITACMDKPDIIVDDQELDKLIPVVLRAEWKSGEELAKLFAKPAEKERIKEPFNSAKEAEKKQEEKKENESPDIK